MMLSNANHKYSRQGVADVIDERLLQVENEKCFMFVFHVS